MIKKGFTLIESVCAVSIGTFLIIILFSFYRSMNFFANSIIDLNEEKGTFITFYNEVYSGIKNSNEVIVDGLNDINIVGGTGEDKRILFLKRYDIKPYILLLRKQRNSPNYELHRLYLSEEIEKGKSSYFKSTANYVCNDISSLEVIKVKEDLLKITVGFSESSFQLFIAF